MKNVLTKNNRINSRTHIDKFFNTLTVIFMLLFAFSFIFIFVWMFFNSLRTYQSYNTNSSNMFDFEGVSLKNLFDNYKTIFNYTSQNVQLVNGKRTVVTTNFLTMLKNSVIQMTFTTIGIVLFPPLVGYVIAKYEFRLKKIIIGMVVASMCIPSIGTSVSTISLYTKLGMINTWWPVIITICSGLGFGVLLYGNYFKSIPWAYAESAKLDGANNLLIYVYIMMPQALPIILAQLVMGIIGVWNDYMTPFLYMPNNPNIAYGIYNISSEYSDKYPIVFAGLMVTSSLTLLLYAFFSKTIMSSMSVGGVKG